MLSTDIEEMQREYPEGLEEQTGACKFCGQYRRFKVLKEWDEDMINEAATEKCDCTEAQIYKVKKSQKEKVYKRIAELFEGKDRAIEIMEKSVDAMLEGELNSAALDLGFGVKGKIGMKADGSIKISHTDTDKKEFIC